MKAPMLISDALKEQAIADALTMGGKKIITFLSETGYRNGCYGKIYARIDDYDRYLFCRGEMEQIIVVG